MFETALGHDSVG
jgi:hypothetical protein